jgi:hypothetical protein
MTKGDPYGTNILDRIHRWGSPASDECKVIL